MNTLNDPFTKTKRELKAVGLAIYTQFKNKDAFDKSYFGQLNIQRNGYTQNKTNPTRNFNQ